MTSENSFSRLVNLVNETHIDHIPVRFPLTHQGEGNFEFANGVTCRFSVLGAGYLSERIPQFSYAWFTKRARENEWDAIAAVCAEHARQLQGEYVIALYQHEVVGVMSNYNPVPHQSLLKQIEKAGLADDVYGYYLDSMGMTIDLRIPNMDERGLLVGMRISNGHSGHYALRYYSIIKAEGYEWLDKHTGAKRRHLSRVQEAVNAMNEGLRIAGDLKVDMRLSEMPAAVALDLAYAANQDLSVRQERLLGAAKDARLDNALQLVVWLGGYAGTAGYKSTVQKLIDPIINHVLGRGA